MAPFRNSYPINSHHPPPREQQTTEDDDVGQCKKRLEESQGAMISSAMRLIQKQKTLLSRFPGSLTLIELEKLERAAKDGSNDADGNNSISPKQVLSKAASFFDKTVDKLQNHSDETLRKKDQEIRTLKGTVKDVEQQLSYILDSSKSTPGQPSVQEAMLRTKQAEEESSRIKKELKEYQDLMLSNALDLIQKQKKLLAPLPSNLTSIELENLERKTQDNEIPPAVAFSTATSYLDHIVSKFHNTHDWVMKRMCEEARVLHEKVADLEAKNSELSYGKGDGVITLELVEDCLASIEKEHPKMIEIPKGRAGNNHAFESIVPRLKAIQCYMEKLNEGNNSRPMVQGEVLSIKSRIAVFDQRRDDNQVRSLEAKISQLERTNEELRAKHQEQEIQCEADRAALLKCKHEATRRRDADVRMVEEQCETLSGRLSAMEAESNRKMEATLTLHREERRALQSEVQSLTNQLTVEKSRSAVQTAALEDAKVLVEEQSITRAKLAERIDTLEDELSQSMAKLSENSEAKAPPLVCEVEGNGDSKDTSDDAEREWKRQKEQMEADHERRVRNLKILVEDVEAQRDRLRAERDELRMSRSGRHWVDQVQHLEAERDRLVGDLRTSLVEVEAERDQLMKERDGLRSGHGGATTHAADSAPSSSSAETTEQRRASPPTLMAPFPSGNSDDEEAGSDRSAAEANEVQMLHGGKFAEKAFAQARLIASLQEENEIKDVRLQNLQDTVDRLLEGREENAGRFSAWRKTLGGKAKKNRTTAMADAEIVTEDEEREGR